MKRPLISVIIPAYNSEKFIEETIRSVLSQTFTDFEIIVIDDGSTDNQKDKITSLCKQDERIQYHYQSNRGVSAARNTGFRRSSGDYLAFLDADDVWLPDNLKIKLKKFEGNDFGLVHGDVLQIDDQSEIIPGILAGKEGHVLNDLLQLRETVIPGPSSILIKRSILEKNGLFDEQLSTSADYEFFIRVASIANIGRVAKPTLQYRVHSNNMHKNIRAMERDVVYVFDKARRNKLFYSWVFRRKCFANMYLTLAANWAGDGKNRKRAVMFGVKAIFENPFICFRLLRNIFKWAI